ncbi:glycosyltransferase family 32 protein [Planktosalinus lacus]|uniref:Glycosyl transferase n=1 Tax=Planktosalinus lacus TaxID=1526573 RepID=A0A8J2V8N9_9FLAO|nr:glycosyltransferase [Planktosalinus lacus]GGD84837.1 glycosyl transferase [Planktosalinus lacus]
MIPKIIHYCWFGKKPKPRLVQKCIESWSQYCPNFRIKEWNEDNTGHVDTPFFRNALRKKQYAFAADYIRALVLYKEGGIYLDTDMLLLKPINSLLHNRFFIGEEAPGRINFAIFGSISGNYILEFMLKFYHDRNFDSFSPPVITHTFSSYVFDMTVEEDIIFPAEVFYAMPYGHSIEDYSNFITQKSLAVHLWNHSWKPHKKETTKQYFKNLLEVLNDYFFYGYSIKYLKRYGKEFLRKIYYKLFKQK